MKENLKLSIWDAFAFYLSGWAVISSAYVHVVIHDSSVNKLFKEIPSTALGFSGFLVPLVVGLLFEPIANRIGGVVLFVCELIVRLMHWVLNWFKPRKRLKGCPMMKLVESDIPPEIFGKIVPYHWAKDYLSQEKVDASYMPFLSKFGFYRNIGTLLLINSALIPYFYGFGAIQKTGFCVLLAGSALYFWRSQMFFKHMGDSVFRHYLVLLERNKRNPKSDTTPVK